MDLLNITSLGSGIGGDLSGLALKKITVEVSGAQGQGANAAFKLNEMSSQGLIKTFSVTCNEGGLMIYEVTFPDTPPVDPQENQSVVEEVPIS